jgi:hypothetical protein
LFSPGDTIKFKKVNKSELKWLNKVILKF